jgi:hypothetical protein
VESLNELIEIQVRLFEIISWQISFSISSWQRALKRKSPFPIKSTRSNVGFVTMFSLVQCAVIFVSLVIILPLTMGSPDIGLHFNIGMGLVNGILIISWWLSVYLVILATVQQLARQYLVRTTNKNVYKHLIFKLF